MMSNAPQHPFAVAPALTAVHSSPEGAVTWVLNRLQRAVCAMHGHDSVLQYERNRMYLRCTSCGYASPGWEVTSPGSAMAHRPGSRPALSADFTPLRKIA
jgi:hypothetical protein